jgi:hypothetical protein
LSPRPHKQSGITRDALRELSHDVHREMKISTGGPHESTFSDDAREVATGGGERGKGPASMVRIRGPSIAENLSRRTFRRGCIRENGQRRGLRPSRWRGERVTSPRLLLGLGRSSLPGP